MIPNAEQRSPGRLAFVALLVGACPCCAEAVQPPADAAGTTDIVRTADVAAEPGAANQAVAIEPTTPESPLPDQDAKPPTAAGLVHKSQHSTRLVRPRRLSDGEMSPAEHATPWYRTGIGALSVVLAVVATAYWLVKRWMPGARTAETGVLRVVGRAALTPKQSATLLQMGRRFVLVAVSPDRVDALCEVGDPDEVAELTARIGAPAAPGTEAFDALLAGEAIEYRTESDEAAHGERAAAPAAEAVRTSRPLTDLLRRLQGLQSQSQ